MTALAVEDTKTLASKALDLLEDHHNDILRCDALTCLGQAERFLGEGQHREHLIEAARLAQQAHDVDRLVAAVFENGGGVGDVAGADADRIELIGAALNAIGPTDSTTRARFLALRALELGTNRRRRFARAFEVAEDTLATARRVNDPATLSFVLHTYADAKRVPHTLPHRLEARNRERRARQGSRQPASARVGDPGSFRRPRRERGPQDVPLRQRESRADR